MPSNTGPIGKMEESLASPTYSGTSGPLMLEMSTFAVGGRNGGHCLHGGLDGELRRESSHCVEQSVSSLSIHRFGIGSGSLDELQSSSWRGKVDRKRVEHERQVIARRAMLGFSFRDGYRGNDRSVWHVLGLQRMSAKHAGTECNDDVVHRAAECPGDLLHVVEWQGRKCHSTRWCQRPVVRHARSTPREGSSLAPG